MIRVSKADRVISFSKVLVGKQWVYFSIYKLKVLVNSIFPEIST